MTIPSARKIRSSRLTGERKPITAIFTDVVGSTTLNERIDPEDWSQIMNGAFEILSASVNRYEGTVAQLQGDAMVAFFGAPVAHEDDPERAVRAALDMITGITQYGEQVQAEYDFDFQVRCGVSSGQVLVGNIGSDQRYEYTALGDSMNTAARLQGAADPMTVLVTEATYRLTEAVFDFVELEPLTLKGKAAPVRGFRVIGARFPRAALIVAGARPFLWSVAFQRSMSEGLIAPSGMLANVGRIWLRKRPAMFSSVPALTTFRSSHSAAC